MFYENRTQATLQTLKKRNTGLNKYECTIDQELTKGQNPLHQFPRNKLARAKVRCLLCRVVSQILLQRLVANLLRTFLVIVLGSS